MVRNIMSNFKRPKIPIILNYTNYHYEIAITNLFGIGPKKAKLLLESVDTIQEIFTETFLSLSKKTGISKDVLKKMNRDGALLGAEKIYSDCQKFGIDLIFYTHPNYPRRLKQCADAPLLLYTKGMLNLNEIRFVGVVGTRNATDYGKKICAELIESFVGNNIIVVSGLAYGIDITIHKLCVQHGVPTIGVLAHGLEMIYPAEHSSTAKKMCNDGGLISEYPPFSNPDREHFPMRNRIVAGMCDATIVVESKIRGGSLITAELANDYSKDVFAFPGSVFEENAAGCNKLIAESKANLITNGRDFLLKMGWDITKQKVIQRSIFPVLSVEENAIVQELINNPEISIDGIASNLKMPISSLSVHLFQMEMNGVLVPIPGNRCKLI